MAIAKRVVQLGANCGIRLSNYRRISASNCGSVDFLSSVSDKSSANKFDYRRQISQLAKPNGEHRAFPVDTLALVRKLEAPGMPSKQAEAITSVITEVLTGSLENAAQSLVSSADKQELEMDINGNHSKFQSEVQSSQDHHYSMLQREFEKLRNDIDTMRTELKYEVDKLTAGQRLDLNLERGRIHDDLAVQNTETTNLSNKFDREIHALRAQLEATKYEVIKYCIGTLVSVSAIGLGVVRLYV